LWGRAGHGCPTRAQALGEEPERCSTNTADHHHDDEPGAGVAGGHGLGGVGRCHGFVLVLVLVVVLVGEAGASLWGFRAGIRRGRDGVVLGP